MRVNMIAGRQPVLAGSSSAKVVSNQQPRNIDDQYKIQISITDNRDHQPVLAGSSSAKVESNQQPRLTSNFTQK